MQKRRILTIVLLLGILVIWHFIKKDKQPQTIGLIGSTMGTIPYSIKYIDPQSRNFQTDIDSLLIDFNRSLSTYIPESEISNFNATDSIVFRSNYMETILKRSVEIFKNSGGAYDPTVGPLVNAWGFGPNKKAKVDSVTIESLLKSIGFDRIEFDAVGATKPVGTYLDFSASAKGYGIDVVAEFLKTKGVKNYMVEIGGEVSCLGKTQQGSVWKIGIEKPQLDQPKSELFATVFLKDRSMATSGNYRNYYQKEGKIIAHTISPFTGYPVAHHLLSASVFAKNCTRADGYATACMVLGLEKSIDMIDQLDGVEGFLIYTNAEGRLKSYISPGIKSQIEVLTL